MKKRISILSLLLVLLLISPSFAIVIAPFDSATDLADHLKGTGVEISNATYTGAPGASGYFSDGSAALGISSGIVLTSGFVSNIDSLNSSGSITGNNGLPGDSQLTALVPGYTTYDATVLSFQFTTIGTSASFTYVFGSDEYNEYVGTSFNDVFGFFLDGVNYAVLPGTTTPVSVNSINNGSNSSYYKDNTGGAYPIEYDGLTTPLVAAFTGLTPGQIYTLKLAIADSGDHILDAGVFIQAGSFGEGTSGGGGGGGVPPVPEPTSMLLVGSGLLWVAGFRKKIMK